MRKRVLTLLLAVVVGCVPAEQKTKSPVLTPSTARAADSAIPAIQSNVLSAVSSANDSLVRPAAIGPVIGGTCDSAAAIVRAALSLVTDRKEGDFHDTPRGAPRTGCRLTAQGSFKALPEKSSGPVDILHAAFIRHGWRPDLRLGDDEDTVTRAPTPADDIYRIVVECARDVASNSDGEVPDSVWSIAAKAGLDSLYAISLTLTSPPYSVGDFDGDRVADAAVLIEHRMTGKLGVAIVHRGTRKVTVLAAGSGSAGPDDLDGITELAVFFKGTTLNTEIRVAPNAPLTGDALWVAGNGSTTGFYIWNGSGFAYEPHRK